MLHRPLLTDFWLRPVWDSAAFWGQLSSVARGPTGYLAQQGKGGTNFLQWRPEDFLRGQEDDPRQSAPARCLSGANMPGPEESGLPNDNRRHTPPSLRILVNDQCLWKILSDQPQFDDCLLAPRLESKDGYTVTGVDKRGESEAGYYGTEYGDRYDNEQAGESTKTCMRRTYLQGTPATDHAPSAYPRRLAYPDGYYDVGIVVMGLWQHESPLSLLAEWARVAKKLYIVDWAMPERNLDYLCHTVVRCLALCSGLKRYGRFASFMRYGVEGLAEQFNRQQDQYLLTQQKQAKFRWGSVAGVWHTVERRG